MLSDNPNSGFYEADTSRTLDQGGGNPTCNQGGIAVVAVQDSHAAAYGISRATCNMGQNAQFAFGVDEELEPTLISSGPGVIAHPTTYCMTTGSFTEVVQEQTPTLMARDYKDPPVVNEPEYVVRRLTPTECARLQGFPDWWCADLGTKVPTQEELDWWAEVFETQRRISGASSKPKTRKQIFKWLQNPHSDAAEYRLWGNGVALPNVCFVLAGIAWAGKGESIQ